MNVYTDDPFNQGSYTVLLYAYSSPGGSAINGLFPFTVDLTVSDCLTAMLMIDSSIIENPIYKIYDTADQYYPVNSAWITNDGTSCPGYSITIRDESGTIMNPIFWYDDVY